MAQPAQHVACHLVHRTPAVDARVPGQAIDGGLVEVGLPAVVGFHFQLSTDAR